MTDTITNMELKHVDTFKVSELMEEDLIGIDGEVCEVIKVEDTDEGYIVSFLDTYGEKDFIEVHEDETFDIYVLME